MQSEKPKRKIFRQEDVIASYIHRPLGLEIVRLLWHTNITANQITLFRVILNIISLVFFAQGTPSGFIVGFILFQIHEVLDTVDGMYSRYKKQTSKIGAYMEYLFDELFSTSYGLFGLAIAYGAYSATDNFIYIWLFISVSAANSMNLAFLTLFEPEKICKNDEIHNIDHDSEEFPAIFGVGLKKGFRNLIFTSMKWKNEFLLWGGLFFFYFRQNYGIDTIIIAFIIHALIVNAMWIKRAFVGYKKAIKMDRV
jgi:phosphatidylglycerophosphate synthase